MNTDTATQLEQIDHMLDLVIENGMEAEVVLAALMYMKEHPEVTPVEAFTLGIAEWIK